MLLSQEKVHARVPLASKARVLLVSGPTRRQQIAAVVAMLTRRVQIGYAS